MKISMHNWMRVEPIEETLQRLSALGYDGLDLKGEPELYDAAEVLELCKKYGIVVSSCVTIMSGDRSLIASEAEQRAGGVAYVKSCMKLLHDVGGKVMTVVPGEVGNTMPNASPEQEWRFAVESLKECYAYAEKLGLQLSIEAINRFETHFINKAEQALMLAEAVGPDCGVCLDTFHMNIEEEDFLRAIELVKGRLYCVHVADSNRMPPGQGRLRWRRIIAALRRVGYDGYLSVEFSPAVDRTPASSHLHSLDAEKSADEDEEIKFIRDHGSSAIKADWYTELSAQAIDYLRNLPLSSPEGAMGLSAEERASEIVDVRAYWLQTPIAESQQHVSDFGRITSFDCVLVEVETRDGAVGYGEAKASVGSSGSCGAIVSCVLNDLKPQLIGMDAKHVSRVWETLYNGTRDHYALSHGRSFPVLGRRGLLVSAMSGVDIALWDLKGKRAGLPVVDLLGGSCRDKMPAYASGGWADESAIGEQVLGYAKHGFKAVKMRVGIMDGSPQVSARRVWAAREALGPDVKIMVDAHGTLSVPEAKRFCQLVEDADIYWFEEPCNSDNYEGTAEVRKSTIIPIAVGESEFTRFDMRDVLLKRAADFLQPDCAIIGGITEAMRVAHLADTFQVALAPHCWGSAISFQAGCSVAFASASAVIIEYSLGGNPMLHELVNESFGVNAEGNVFCPSAPGLGVTINRDFVKEYTQKIW